MSAHIEYLRSPKEIPPGENYILIESGDESKTIRHGRGLTIILDQRQSADLREFQLSEATRSAQILAKTEGIAKIFICNAR
jgi:hypothetical protein